MENLLSGITIDSDVSNGNPSIRKLRFTVVQLLELLAAGMTKEEILNDYPYLDKDDIYTCLQYAVLIVNVKSITPSIAA